MKVRVKREDDRTEIRWRLWLRVEVVLVRDADGGDAGDADGWGDSGHGYGLRLTGCKG